MTKVTTHSIIGILTCIIVVLFVAYYFVYTGLSALGQDVFDISQKVQQNSQQQQDVHNSIDSLTVLKPQIAIIDSYFIGPDGEVAFIDELENKAKALGLAPQISSVQIEKSPEIAPKGLEYLSLKFSIRGTWSTMYTFISLLPNMPYQITIDQADISNVSDNGSSARSQWQGSFAIRVLKQSK